MWERRGIAKRLGGFGSVGHMPGRHPAQPFEPVVYRPVERHHLHFTLDHLDERHEQFAVQAAQIKIARRAVGRGDDRHPRFEEMREKPGQDHGVGAVVDHHFVEGEQPRLGGNRLRHRRDRIAARGAPGRSRGAFEPEVVKRTRRGLMVVDSTTGPSAMIFRDRPPHNRRRRAPPPVSASQTAPFRKEAS